MSTIEMSYKEELSGFFKEPNRERLREILQKFDSEYDQLDFKTEWIDHAKLAKHVLAMANSRGGVIVFGISENDDNTLSVVGLDKLKDKADIAVDQYLPGNAKDIYNIESFEYSSSDWEELEGKKFQVMFVENRPAIIPLISQKRAEGRIHKDTIYVRKNTKSVKAGQSEMDNLIGRRVREQLNQESKDLRDDLTQLKTLYDFAERSSSRRKTRTAGSHELDEIAGIETNVGLSTGLSSILNDTSSEFYDFIDVKIHQKKEQIDKQLNLE